MLPAPRRPASAGGLRGPSGLPAPVAFETARTVHTLLPSGRIRIFPAHRSRCGGVTLSLVGGEGACLVPRASGRFAIVRDGREVWRSSGRYRLTGVFAKLGPRVVAFSYESYERRSATQTLLLARPGRHERVIAVGERPLGWTGDRRLLTWRVRRGGADVYVRSSDGTMLRRLAAGLADVRFDPRTTTLFMLSRSGLLSRHDGRNRQRIASLQSLAFSQRATIELLEGGLIGVLARSRLAVLRRDGSLAASATLHPGGRNLSLADSSGLVANRTGTAVAFTVSEGNTGYRSIGRETVYVLRAGDRRSAPVFSHRLRFGLCERWTSLAWHGDWLLYATTEGNTLAIDTKRPHVRIDLTRLAARIGGRAGTDGKVDLLGVRWARGE
jgi:hypothetical protein